MWRVASCLAGNGKVFHFSGSNSGERRTRRCERRCTAMRATLPHGVEAAGEKKARCAGPHDVEQD
jgi:hypothetical protein